MNRATVCIGVDKTGTLPKLNDAVNGAKWMGEWAARQGFDPVVVITDEEGPVRVDPIYDAVKAIVDRATVDQLVVYFAGHGVNLGYSEYWLLSEAPERTAAAVNVRGSVELARWCGIPHVVFISDACRTAADSIRAQSVTGSEIFPNTGMGGPEKAVDLFFACAVGKPALEVKDSTEAANHFKAIYTKELCNALNGDYAEAIETAADGSVVGYVRPHPLKKFLQAVVPKRLFAMGLGGVNQVPDARITSNPDAWLARVAAPRRTRNATPSPKPEAIPEQETLFTVSRDLLHAALQDDPTAGSSPLPDAAAALPHAKTLARTPLPFGPSHYETECGFKTQGAGLREAVCATARVELLDSAGGLVRVYPEGPGHDVLLVFEDGTGTVLPAIRGFLASLVVEEGELAAVSYEPSDQTPRWHEFQGQANEIRALRGVIASATQFGVFRLEEEDAIRLARRMQISKFMDPAMALYAAYAYHDLRRLDLIEEMSRYLRAELGLRLFDLELLDRALYGHRVDPNGEVLPFFPLLAQGWALLSANNVALPLPDLRQHLRPSLWTLFDPEGVEMLRDVLSG